METSSQDSLLKTIVDPNGSGDYRTIQEAVSNARPGQTILVKNGTYNRKLDFRTSGTPVNPIIVKPFQGHRPVLDFSNSPDKYPRVEINADYIIFEGFEVRNGWEGVKIYGFKNIIRNNNIHSNNLSGITIVNAGYNLIEQNFIEGNGLGPDKCTTGGVPNPKQCHGIYLSNFECGGNMDANVIRGNHILRHPGRGIQWNGRGCKNYIQSTVVEDNRIENNSWGIVLYYGVYNSIIRNNTFISKSMPETNDDLHTLIGIYSSQNNLIENNTFETEFPDVSGLFVFDKASSKNWVNNNTWKLKSQQWIWEGDKRRDWKNYKSVTGWGENSTFETYKP